MKRWQLIIFFLMTSTLAFGQLLEEYKWEKRVVLLFSPSKNHTMMKQQLAVIENEAGEMLDRHMVVLRLYLEEGEQTGNRKISRELTNKIRSKYQVKKNEFTFILIGKDGGEKLRSTKFTDLKSVFNLIDSMPMRQAEMRAKQKN